MRWEIGDVDLYLCKWCARNQTTGVLCEECMAYCSAVSVDVRDVLKALDAEGDDVPTK